MEVQQRLDMVYRPQNKHQVASVEELLKIPGGPATTAGRYRRPQFEIAALERKFAIRKGAQKQAEELGAAAAMP